MRRFINDASLFYATLIAAAQARNAIAPLAAVNLGDAFAFVMNGMTVYANGSGAAALAPAVALQLSVDACARTFNADAREMTLSVQCSIGCF
jgi:hypothetical protein